MIYILQKTYVLKTIFPQVYFERVKIDKICITFHYSMFYLNIGQLSGRLPRNRSLKSADPLELENALGQVSAPMQGSRSLYELRPQTSLPKLRYRQKDKGISQTKLCQKISYYFPEDFVKISHYFLDVFQKITSFFIEAKK